MQDVTYEIFERCVKRFGYAVDLTDDCWRATVAETHVDIEKFKEPGNIQHHYFQHKALFNTGRYEARKVLYIAFLHCKHTKRAVQERSLWGIINPQLEDFISHEQADKFFDDMALCAIDLPLEHCQSWMEVEVKKSKNDENYVAHQHKEKYEKAIEYLSKCKQDREEKVE